MSSISPVWVLLMVCPSPSSETQLLWLLLLEILVSKMFLMDAPWRKLKLPLVLLTDRSVWNERIWLRCDLQNRYCGNSPRFGIFAFQFKNFTIILNLLRLSRRNIWMLQQSSCFLAICCQETRRATSVGAAAGRAPLSTTISTKWSERLLFQKPYI